MPLLALRSLYEAGAGAINVTVNLTGVAADPQIGTGTVLIGAVAPSIPDLVAGGGRWYGRLEDVKVYLTGVAARPRVGKGVLVELGKLYPFPKPRALPEPLKRIPSLTRAPQITEEAITETIVIRLVGVQSVSTVGNVTVRTVTDLLDEELVGIIELLELEEAA